MKEEFTTTENLVIEVLIARRRMGEHLWTFGTDVRRQLSKLEEAGWVHVMNGIVENTVRASLTDKGVARWLSFEYKSPRKIEGAKEEVKKAKALRKRFGGKNFWVTEEES